jgi:RNA polymerase sigma-70 factor, ECF subfamily
MPAPSRAPLSLVVGQTGRAASDADLARSLVAGEAWAIVETWHRFAPLVIMTAERALGSRSEAEDVAQEVFQRVFRKAGTLRDVESLRSFIYSFAVRILKTELRYRRVRAWLSFRRPETIVELSGSTMDVEARDLLEKFYALLDRLDARDRLVFLLRRTESMTIEEIAATMDISVSTVKRSLAHASKRLSRWVDLDPELAGLLPRQERQKGE